MKNPGASRQNLTFYLILFLFSTLLGCMTYAQDHLTYLANPAGTRNRSSGYFLYLNLVNWYLWILLEPAILRLTRRFPLIGFTNVAPHIPAAFLASLAVGEVGVILKWLPLARVFSLSSAYGIFYHNRNFVDDLLWGVTGYFFFAGCATAFLVYQELESRKVAAAETDGALARAELLVLKSALASDSLLNRLDRILATLRVDPDKADRMIVRTAGKLRSLLRKRDIRNIAECLRRTPPETAFTNTQGKHTFARIWAVAITLVVGLGLIRALSHSIWSTGSFELGSMASSLRAIGLWLSWGIIAPAVYRCSLQWPLLAKRWKLSLAKHSILFLITWALISFALQSFYQRDFTGGRPLMESTIYWLSRSQFLVTFVTYWFIVFIGQAADSMARRSEQELRMHRVKGQLNRAYQDALLSQLRPHFLFNALNTVAELTHHDPEKAERMLGSIRDLLGKTLVASRGPEITLEEEMSFIEDYLRIQEIRFGDRLKVRREIAPDAREANVPLMILQPLVENSITHAFVGEAGGDITIRSNMQDHALVIDIEDSGQSGKPIVQPGIGLTNTAERLQSLYGKSALLELGTSPGGFRVRLTIPQPIG